MIGPEPVKKIPAFMIHLLRGVDGQCLMPLRSNPEELL